MKYCPKCNCEYIDGLNLCQKDGTPLEIKEAEIRHCPYCGLKLIGSGKYCPECGYSIENQTNVV